MNSEQERAEFEAWANGRCELHLVNPAGRYSSAITQFAWEAYQAGRAALAAQAQEAAPAAQGEPSDPIRRLIEAHAHLLEANEYAYFELAYTRQTGWMAWLTDKPLCAPVTNPDRLVLAQGQGATPDEACDMAARAAQQKGASNG